MPQAAASLAPAAVGAAWGGAGVRRAMGVCTTTSAKRGPDGVAERVIASGIIPRGNEKGETGKAKKRTRVLIF